MFHSSLLNELHGLKIKKSKRFFQLIDDREYSKALLHACEFCEANDTQQLKAIEILLRYRDKLNFDNSKKSSTKKNCVDYAVENKNRDLYMMLHRAGMHQSAVVPKSIVTPANEEELLRVYLSVHDEREYNVLREHFSNQDTLPSKFTIPNDDDNRRYDRARIEIILRAIDYLRKLQLDYSNHPKLTTDQKEVIEQQVLLEAKELLLHISMQIFNLSKHLRERYEHCFQPAPFTWYTLEQLASMIVIPTEAVIHVFNFGPHIVRSSSETFAALLSFKEEVNHRMEIFDAAITEIIKTDLPALRYFFTAIKVNLDNPAAEIPVKPVRLTATKAIVTHLRDTMSLYQLLSMIYLVDNKRLPPELVQQQQSSAEQAPKQIVYMPSNATRYSFDTKPGLFASLRRLQLIGELITGKNFSRQLTDLDETVDWQAFIGIRDHTVHQDQDDFKQRVASIFSQPQLFEEIYKKDLEELGNVLVKLIVARHAKTGGFDVNAKKGAQQYCARIMAEFYKHQDAIKVKEEAGKDRCKMASQEERRVTEEEERRFILFLMEFNKTCAKSEMIDDELMEKIIKIFHGQAGKANIIKGKDAGAIYRPIARLGRGSENALELSAIWKKAIDSYDTTEDQRKEHFQERSQLRQEREQAEIDKKKGFDNVRRLAKILATAIAPAQPIDTLGHIAAVTEALANIQECLQWLGVDPGIFLDKQNTLKNGMGLMTILEQYHLIRHAIEYNITQFCLHLEKLHALKLVDERILTPKRAYSLRVMRNHLEHGISLIERWEHKPSTTEQQPQIERVRQVAEYTSILLAYFVPEIPLIKARWKQLQEAEQNPHHTQWFGTAEREPTRAEWGMYLISARERYGIYARLESAEISEEPSEHAEVLTPG